MAGGKLQAPRGTFDVLPEDARRRDRLVELSAQVLEGAGYAHAETPIFEDTALFARGVGESTDIVQKEMFTFEDKGGRSLTLRPENTAGICRAYIEHGMHKLPQPVKLWSCGAVLPPRGAPGRPLPAVHAARTSRRWDPTTRRWTPS